MPGKSTTADAATGQWQRHSLLACAILLTGLGVLLGWTADSASESMAQGVCLKTGIVTFMWWLALPQLRKLNPFMTGGVAVLALVAVVRPQILLVLPKVVIALAPLLGLLWLFMKMKRKS